MPIPTNMQDLSTVEALNSPAGPNAIGNNLDNYLRAIQRIVRTTNAKGANLAASATMDIGAATAEFIDVTGSATITSLGTVDAGIARTVRFTGTCTLTHSANIVMPGSQNYTTSANDVLSFRSLGAGAWVCSSILARPVQAGTAPVVDSISALKALNSTANPRAFAVGYYAAGDGGGGHYYHDTADTTSSDNGGTIIVANDGARWKLIDNGVVSFEQFGAKIDGTDAATAINNAFLSGLALTARSGAVFDVSSSISVPSNSAFSGFNVTIRRKTGSGVYDVVKNSDQSAGNSNIRIFGLAVDGNKDADSLVATNPAHRFSGISMVKVTSGELRFCKAIGTVNAEGHGGIYAANCVRFDIKDCDASANDRTGIVLFTNSRCEFVGNNAYSNTGSGITGGDNDDCYYAGNNTNNNGSGGTYSGLNPSGKRVRVIGNVSYSNTGSGINIGEASYDASDAELIGNISYSNTLEGITVGYSDRVRVAANEVHSNVRNNIRIFQGADECVIANNIVRDSAGGQGIYVDDGVRHNITGNLVKGNAISGISIDPTATDGICKGNICINNGVITSANSAGILANTTTGWLIDGNQCYDTAGAGGTQESGIWMAGGSGNVVSGNRLHTNKTNSIRETSSPSYERRFNKVGTDPLRGTFTSAASTTTTVNNNNATAVSRIKVWPTNAGGVGKIPFVSSVVSGVSFTITLPSAGAGTETYAYEIE